MTDQNRPINPDDTFFTAYSFLQIACELRADTAYARTGKSSRSLVKSTALSMVLMTLNEGACLKEHHAPTTATVVVLEGRINFVSALGSHELGPLESGIFSSQLEHEVEALQESLLLLLIGGKR